MNIDTLLAAKVDGVNKETITVTFEKKINVKQFETETFSGSCSIEMNREITGMERTVVESLLAAQLEYSVLVQARTKGYVSQEELNQRIATIETDIALLNNKAISLGVDLSKIIK